MLKLAVDNSGEKFGDKVSIADLAAFSFNGRDSDTMHIYQADNILAQDWRDELAGVEMEYLVGVSATFKDGSALRVSAWADCCRPDDDGRMPSCKWCGGRY